MTALKRLLPTTSQICSSCRRPLSTTARARRPAATPMNAFDAIKKLEAMAKRSRANPTTTADPNSQLAPSQSESERGLDSRIKGVFQRAVNFSKRGSESGYGSESQNSQSLAGQSVDKLAEDAQRAAMELQMGRRWFPGDVYAPNDLGPREGRKWMTLQKKPSRDVFEMLGADPRKFYKNMPLLAEFVTETGKIKHNNLTGLKPKNQRRLAKAIRRAVGCGLMPSVHKHPEVIARDLEIEKFRKARGG